CALEDSEPSSDMPMAGRQPKNRPESGDARIGHAIAGRLGCLGRLEGLGRSVCVAGLDCCLERGCLLAVSLNFLPRLLIALEQRLQALSGVRSDVEPGPAGILIADVAVVVDRVQPVLEGSLAEVLGGRIALAHGVGNLDGARFLGALLSDPER